jgi:RHS repeat-associated protein
MGGEPGGAAGGKPHLLVEVRNNLGAETRIRYVASTTFYLADKAAGRPWITRLPFPVHVVERVETDDRISRNRFVTRYAYHHGFFDGEEREFRGFAMVEQWDTEEFAALAGVTAFPSATNLDAASNVPPVYTKTWFHTGVFLARDRVSTLFAGTGDAEDVGEYYREPGLSPAQARALLLPDSRLPAEISPQEEPEAFRALKGMMLRQEVYGDDKSTKQDHPYTVTEQNYNVRLLQRRGPNRHAVFLTHPSESVTFHYERDPTDPRVTHRFALEVDSFGNVVKEADAAYARRLPDVTLQQADRDVQAQVLVRYSENIVTGAVNAAGAYRTPLPCELRSYELTGYAPTGTAARFRTQDFVAPDPTDPAGERQHHLFDSEINYEQTPTAGRQRRLIEQTRTLYRANDLTGLLPLRALDPMALTGENYKLVFTPGLLARVFVHGGQPLIPDPATTLGTPGSDTGGLVDLDGDGRLWNPSGRVFLSEDPSHAPSQELSEARDHFFLQRRYQDPFGSNTTTVYDSYDLLPIETRDAVGNRLTAGERDGAGALGRSGIDYRVLRPATVMDANRNRAAVAFDALGMVVGTAVMGKPEEHVGDTLDGFTADLTDTVALAHIVHPLTDPGAILGRATTRLVYDLFAYQRQAAPTAVYTLGRETHDADLGPGGTGAMQHTLSYSDGFGRDIQKKMQAEAGPVPGRDSSGAIILGADGLPEMTPNDVSPRWVGSGWMVYNNKGNPVRRYEPFFTVTHRFEFDVRTGVSPVLFYDPAERVVATLYPDHTWDKVLFTPWRQETWDVNDTVDIPDPAADPCAGAFFARLPSSDYTPTWYATRVGGGMGPTEQAAARKAAAHAATPTVAHGDVLGRAFLTVAHNRLERAGATVEQEYPTRIQLDIEGNHRAVRDAVVENGDKLGRVVMRYDYDLLGTRIHEASTDAGERWILNDAAGKALRAWDSRGHALRSAYDPLRRPIRTLVTGADPHRPNAELLTDRVVYGEQHPDGEARNLRGRPCLQFDQAGVVANEAHDFKGNLLHFSRRTARQYRTTLDWTPIDIVLPGDATAIFAVAALDAASAPLVDAETFSTATTYDALNRPTGVTTPDGSVVRHSFNEASLLEKVDVQEAGAGPAWTPIVTDIDYDAKGRRERIAYGNGVMTMHLYDAWSFRLVRLRTARGGDVLQDLSYVYDPVGNVTSIADAAQQAVFFRNAVVPPDATYTYDAVYRLINATGREHIGQQSIPLPWSWNDDGRVRLPHPQDGTAMRSYAERYDYDAVGNILQLAHQAVNGTWTRQYSYEEPSLLEPAKTNNRLSHTSVGSATEGYRYDAHGNTTSMPHLPQMQWEFRDHLSATAMQVRNDDGTPETTYYVYDTAGARVRKVTERQAPPGQLPARATERVYLGAFEVYREYGADGRTISLQRQTLHVLDDKQRIAMIETRTAGQDPAPAKLTRYQLGDHLGSATLELDDGARVISYEEYTPYGSTSYQGVRSQTETPKRYRYTGKEHDEENGFSYHGARYYAPWLGRWVICDPAGMVDGPCLYAYVRNNPVRYFDMTGQGAAEKLLEEAAQSGIFRKAAEIAVTTSAPLVASATPRTIMAGGGLALLVVVAIGVPVAVHYYTGNHPVPYTKPEDSRFPTPAPASFPSAAPPPPGMTKTPPRPIAPPPDTIPRVDVKDTALPGGARFGNPPRDEEKASASTASGGGKPPKPPDDKDEELKFAPPRNKTPALPPDSPVHRPRTREASALYIHNAYGQSIVGRPLQGKGFDINKGSSLEKRFADDYDRKTGTLREFNTRPWASLTQEELSFKLKQVAKDITLLESGAITKAIWYATEAIPSEGLGGQLRRALDEAVIKYPGRFEYKVVPLPPQLSNLRPPP